MPWPVRLLPLPIALLSCGLLLNVAGTIFDLQHFDTLFYGGDSINGAVADMLERTFAYVRLATGPAIIVVLGVSTWRVRAKSRPWRAALLAVCVVFILCCGNWIYGGLSNDGTDPTQLGVVHDARVPMWVHAVDVAAPLVVTVAASVSAVLLLLPSTGRHLSRVQGRRS